MILNKNVKLMVLIFCLHTIKISALNILFVVEYFPARSQPHIINLITGLIDQGHNISIFSFREGDDVEGQSKIEQYRLLDRVIYRNFPFNLIKTDIVFCQSATLGQKILAMKSVKKWVKKRKLVVSLRGADITKNSVKENPLIYSKLFKKTHLFLPVCHYFENMAIQLGCSPEKIVVHHSAIDSSLFFFKERQRRINEPIQCVSVCRLVEKKGIKFAIQAIASLTRRYPQLRYTIVGDGPERPYLEQLVDTLHLTDKVTFTGWGTSDQIVSVLNQSHIFLLPSITAADGDEEGIANALKEAMAMGLIAVGTWHAGTPELIDDGISGFLVSMEDSYELAHKINYIIQNPSKWSSVSLAARKKIEDEFEIKQSIKELENIFNRLLKN